MRIKLRVWDYNISKMYNTTSISCTEKNGHTMQFTGFTDINGQEIYEGDILSDFTNTDDGVKKSHQQVFWGKLQGAWKLDFSFKQDKSEGAFLHNELATFKYEISGNIYENANLIAQK